MLLEEKINKPNVIMRSIHLQLITKGVIVFLDFILQVIKLYLLFQVITNMRYCCMFEIMTIQMHKVVKISGIVNRQT